MNTPVTAQYKGAILLVLASPEALFDALVLLSASVEDCAAVEGTSFGTFSTVVLLDTGVFAFAVLPLFTPVAGATVIERAGMVAYSVC